MPLDTICLDAGGVLVWPNWDRVARVLRQHGVTVEASALAAADPVVRKALDEAAFVRASTDDSRGQSLFARVLAHAGIPPSNDSAAALAAIEAYHRTHNIWEHVPDFVRPSLAALRASGYTLVVVSNANGTLTRMFERLGLGDLVDVVVDSAVEGFEKPDRRLFEVALRRAGSTAERAVHVGDFYYIDVVGARAAGLTPVLVDQADLYAGVDCARIRSVAELLGVVQGL